MSKMGSYRRATVAPQAEPLEPRTLLSAGDLDPTFAGGAGGINLDFAATGTKSDFARAMTTGADGKIVVAGTTGSGSNTDDRIALARLTPDGAPDPTFGTSGRVAFPVLTPSDVEVSAVAVSPVDGKIVVVGAYTPSSATTSDWLVARFNADGSIDNTFSGDGVLTLDGGSHFSDALYGVAIQGDGKIVAVGVAQQFTSQLATLRLKTDGTLDTSFNGTGKSIVDFFGGVDFASDVLIQGDDGKIVVAGGSVVPGSYRHFVLLRYKPDGTLDNSFDGDGMADTDFGVSVFGRQVLRQPDGKYVVSGLVGASSTQNFAAARYNADGSIDGSFGDGSGPAGTVTIPQVFGYTFATYGLARQPDGAILLAGSHNDPSFDTYAAVVRLTRDGRPDDAFGPSGVRLYSAVNTPTGQTNGSDVAVTPEGHILVAGYTFGATIDFVVLAVQSDIDLTPPTVTFSGWDVSPRIDIRVVFSEDVSQSVDTTDLRLQRLITPTEPEIIADFVETTGQGMPTDASWVFTGSDGHGLPDGNYRATLPAGSITDAGGNPLGHDVTVDFFVLAGDANHDRTVDFNDLVVLAQNYNTSGKTFAQGDFNYDGVVDFNDLVLLAQRYNTTLAPGAAAPVQALAAATAFAATWAAAPVAAIPPTPARPKPVTPAKKLFSIEPVRPPAKPAPKKPLHR